MQKHCLLATASSEFLRDKVVNVPPCIQQTGGNRQGQGFSENGRSLGAGARRGRGEEGPGIEVSKNFYSQKQQAVSPVGGTESRLYICRTIHSNGL